jgi:16S rRNA processing protein RimM
MSDLLDVGRIARAHGLKGDVIVALWSTVPERLSPGSVFSTDQGSVTVLSSQPQGTGYLVRLEGINSRTAAEGLRGLVLRAEPLTIEGALWAHEMIGARLIDQTGQDHGEITAMENNPASDLLVLESGALVPLRFVVDVVAGARVLVDVPEGLFD